MLGNTTLMNSINTMPRKLSCKLDAGNSNVITDVKRLTYATDWTGTIAVGQVVSSYISVTVPTPSFSIAGVNVALSMGIGNPVTWTKIGDFRIEEESVRKKQGYTGFNAYDKLYNTINIYHSSGNKTLQAICNEVCTAIGITSTTLSADLTIDSGLLDGYTLRDVLGFIAAYQGKNAYLSPNGVLEFRWFTSAPYVADGTRANIPYIGENDCTIRRWICQTQEGTLTSGSGEGLYFTCPFMTQARLDSLAANQQLVAYRKADVDIPFGNYLLQAGDIITVSTTGSNLTVPIMSNSWTYDGGVASSVSSYGASDYTGTANNAEHSLSATRVQRQMAVYRAASDLKIASEKITGASGGYIRINFGGDGKTAALLIMDTEDISTAQNVWVFNQGGLGHFPNGYDPTAQANVALTADGWVAASRISGEMISGVGIENVAPGTSTRPKIVLEQGEIKFQRVAAKPDGSISNIGSIKFNQRSAQEEIDSLSMRVQYGKTVTIGYDNNGSISDQFIYYSDLSAPNVPSDAAKFNFWGDLRIFSNLHWISMTELDERISSQNLALAEIIDSGAKNKFNIDNITYATSLDINWLTMTMKEYDTQTYLRLMVQKYNNTTAGSVIYYETITQNGVISIPFSIDGTFNTISVGHNGSAKDGKFRYNIESLPYGDYILYIDILNCNKNNGKFSWKDVMICTQTAWNISQNYVLYCPTMQEMYEMIKNL